MSDTFQIIVGILAVVVWALVSIRGYRAHVSLTMMALVLVVLGTTVGFVLLRLDVPAPGLIGYTLSGTLLLLVWGRAIDRT